MSRNKTEKVGSKIKDGKNYNIRKSEIVKVIKYKNDVEINDIKIKSNPFANMKRINKREYVLRDTGEIKKYKLNRTKDVRLLKRSMKNLRMLLRNNFTGEKNELFITLTSNTEIKYIKEIKEKTKKFFKRLKKEYNDLEYIAVFERNESETSFHVHMLVKAMNHKNLYIPNSHIEELWGEGFTKTSRIIDKVNYNEINETYKFEYRDSIVENFGIDRVINYLTKIESKGDIKTGERMYLRSKDIRKPTIYRERYNDALRQMKNEYRLTNEKTILICNPVTDVIQNKIKIENWKKKK